jgi:hypothetical protein
MFLFGMALAQLMLTLLVAGIGLVARSVRPMGGQGERNE